MPVALATDVNPGGGFSPSMPFAMTLACFGMGLTFEEALAAATINGAYSLDRHASVGSLEPGKLMDAVLDRRRCHQPDPRRRPVDCRRRQTRRSRRSNRDLDPRRSNIMKLTDTTVTDLLAAFRSPEPTPGGGSAAALAGAIGASLLAMVAGLPKSRAATAEDAARLKAAGERCAALAAELEALVDRDSEAYDLVDGGLQEAEGDRRGEGGAIRRHPGGDARGDRRAARRDARLRRRRRTGRGDRRARQSVGVERRRRSASSCSAPGCAARS